MLHIPVVVIGGKNKPWETIYKVIDENYFKESKKIPLSFFKCVNKNPNEPHILPNELNKKIKTNCLENCFYQKLF